MEDEVSGGVYLEHGEIIVDVCWQGSCVVCQLSAHFLVGVLVES